MNAPVPAAPKPRKYEYRSTRCPQHANRCAERRERHAQGEWACVFCLNAATAAELLQEPAPATPPVAPSTEALATPPAAIRQPADAAAVVGAGTPTNGLLEDRITPTSGKLIAAYPLKGAPELAPSERGLPTPPEPASASQTPAELKTHADALVLLARALEGGRSAAEVARELRRIGHEVDGCGRRLAYAAAKGGGR